MFKVENAPMHLPILEFPSKTMRTQILERDIKYVLICRSTIITKSVDIPCMMVVSFIPIIHFDDSRNLVS